MQLHERNKLKCVATVSPNVVHVYVSQNNTVNMSANKKKYVYKTENRLYTILAGGNFFD